MYYPHNLSYLKKKVIITIQIYIIIEIAKKITQVVYFMVVFGVHDDLSKCCGNYYRYRKSELLLENCKK